MGILLLLAPLPVIKMAKVGFSSREASRNNPMKLSQVLGPGKTHPHLQQLHTPQPFCHLHRLVLGLSSIPAGLSLVAAWLHHLVVGQLCGKTVGETPPVLKADCL